MEHSNNDDLAYVERIKLIVLRKKNMPFSSCPFDFNSLYTLPLDKLRLCLQSDARSHSLETPETKIQNERSLDTGGTKRLSIFDKLR